MPKQYLNPEGLSKHPSRTTVVKAGQTVYITAQVSTNERGEIVAKDDPEGQVRQVWRNLEIAMNAAGGTIRDIVATLTHVTKPEYMDVVSRVRAELYPTNPPVTSRPLVVSQLASSPDLVVSIGAIAVLAEP